MAEENAGVLILESWLCPKCHTQSFAVHAFAEVLPCISCGMRVASKVPAYQSARDMIADGS